MAEHTNMRILIADGDAANLDGLEQLLEDAGYCDLLSTETKSLTDLCAVSRPDLVVVALDGEINALTLDELARRSDDVPVLLVGSGADPDARRNAFRLGAGDFITRPVEADELLLRIRNLLEIRRLRRALQQRNDVLDHAVRERTLKVEQARLETLRILASVAEYHDDETRHHAQRVGMCAGLIAQALDLPPLLVARIRDAAPLHDIGKIGIARRVLLKPGTLTPAERENMMRHVEIGARILAPARSPVLRLAAEIARTHHEWWDGSGYLAGLAGEEIPLSGRITAVADVFDALTHNRPYRRAWDPEAAWAEIHQQAGHQFDPYVVAAFTSIDRHVLFAAVGADADDQPSQAVTGSRSANTVSDRQSLLTATG